MLATMANPKPGKGATRLDLADYINPAFHAAFYDESRWLVLYGGAGSGKSVFAAQKCLIRLVTEPGHRMLFTRKVARTLRNSVWSLFVSLIRDWGMSPHFDIKNGDMTLVYRPLGNEVICAGLDDPEKIKSIHGVTSLWHEEPTEQMPSDLAQLDLRLRGKTKNYKQHILSFNPVSVRHWLKVKFFDSPPPNATIIKTTYRDNRWLDDEYKAVLESLTGNDARVYRDGEWGVLRGLIFGPWPVIESAPSALDETIYGLDFGFNNPTALVEIGIRDGAAYVNERIYESGLTNSSLISRMNDLGVSRMAPIYADAAEPDRIEEIARAGYNVHPAAKGPGSVSAGVSHVQGAAVRVTRGSDNIIAENGSYRWRTDRNGEPMDEPEKDNDHAMDAIRYALHTHQARATGFGFSIGQ